MLRGADTFAALSALPGKADHKNVELAGAADRLLARAGEFKASWEGSLAYLVVDDLDFEQAFSATADLLRRI